MPTAEHRLVKITTGNGVVVEVHRFSSGAPLASIRVGAKSHPRAVLNVDEVEQIADALDAFVADHEPAPEPDLDPEVHHP